MGYLLLLGLFIVCVVIIWRTRWTKAERHDEFLAGMVGLVGQAEETFTTAGTVRVRGEIWKATSRRGIVERGESVRVVSLADGLTVVVEKVQDPRMDRNGAPQTDGVEE